MGKCISKKSVHLHEINVKNITKLIPTIKKEAFVIKVYDGDTITILYENESDKKVYKGSVRLRGIDTPELRTKNTIEKEIALKAKLEMSNLVYKKYVKLENIDYDKYGRILADIYIKNINVSEYMVNKRLGVKYDGGTKNIPTDWKEYYEKESCKPSI
jgi:micrococcal nuclease